MTDPSPLIGEPKTSLDTPALLVDLDLMEANIARVAETCRAHGIGWRPHTKGQKTPEIIAKELNVTMGLCGFVDINALDSSVLVAPVLVPGMAGGVDIAGNPRSDP